VGTICIGQGLAGAARYRDRHGERVYGQGDVYLLAQYRRDGEHPGAGWVPVDLRDGAPSDNEHRPDGPPRRSSAP
jgi:hypothetical protein